MSKPAVDWQQIEQFLSDEGLPEIPTSVVGGKHGDHVGVVEVAARLCYMSFGRGRTDISRFIGNLLRSRDGSVFEHVNYGFVITGISRTLSHEFVRHRAGFAYSQRSQRYVDEAGAKMVIPPLFDPTESDQEHVMPALQIFLDSVGDSQKRYHHPGGCTRRFPPEGKD